MQSMFRMWNSEPVGVDLPFLKTLKRKHSDCSDSTPPTFDHFLLQQQPQHIAKKWKSEYGAEPAVTQVASVQPETYRNMGLGQSQPRPGPGQISHTRNSAVSSPPVAPAENAEAQKQTPGIDIESDRRRNALQDSISAAASSPQTIQVDAQAAPTALNSSRSAALRDAIDAQFSLEILLKHDELRLIDTEIAKCQVALEQLRRCQLIPHPGAIGFSESQSTGVGPSLEPAPGRTRPSHPAPWAVTDGPYTQHYAKWLIQSPHFDSTTGSSARSSGRPRQSRVSTCDNFSSPIPADTPALKRARLVRKSDGKTVDLRCDMCNTNVFGNVQGFLNHMRIKHQAHYKDHEAAAQSCGVPVEDGDSHVEVTSTLAAARSKASEKPVVNPRPSRVLTPTARQSPGTPLASPGNIPSAPAVVHTLARPNLPPLGLHRSYFPATTTTTPSVPSPLSAAPVTAPGTPSPVAPSHSFVPSTQTPYLSSLLERRGFDGDLATHVHEACQIANIPLIEIPFDEEADSLQAADTPASSGPVPGTRAPVSGRAGKTNTRDFSEPTSATATPQDFQRRKLTLEGLSTVHSGPKVGSGCQASASGLSDRSSTSPMELSPHAAESNPGLVSDHEDDDDDDVRSEAASTTLMRQAEFDDMHIQVADGSCSDSESKKGLSSFSTDTSCRRGKTDQL